MGWSPNSIFSRSVTRLLRPWCLSVCERFFGFWPFKWPSASSHSCAAQRCAGFQPYTQENLHSGGSINRPVLYNAYQHLSEQFSKLLYALEGRSFPLVKARVPTAPRMLYLFPMALVEVSGLRDRLARDFPEIEKRRLGLLHLVMGVLAIRAWPLRGYCEVVRWLLNEDTGRGASALGVVDGRVVRGRFSGHAIASVAWVWRDRDARARQVNQWSSLTFLRTSSPISVGCASCLAHPLSVLDPGSVWKRPNPEDLHLKRIESRPNPIKNLHEGDADPKGYSGNE